jgi:hypothetical protein
MFTIWRKKYNVLNLYICRKEIIYFDFSMDVIFGRLYSVAQPLYTRGTLNIVEESWRHTSPILHIFRGEGGKWFMALIGRDNFL